MIIKVHVSTIELTEREREREREREGVVVGSLSFYYDIKQ